MAANEWVKIEDPNQYKFTSDGETLQGILKKKDRTPTGIPQAYVEVDGEVLFVNCGAELARKLQTVPVGNEVRIVRTGTLDTGQATPMQTFDVEHRRPEK